MPLEERAGHPVHWRRFGEGDRDAVALHCSLASAEVWAGVAAPLAGRLTLTAFDLPGHGQSGDWPGSPDLLTLSAQIAASFIADRPVDLIGHSFGAVAALSLAVTAPEAIRTLTLIEPVLFAAARTSALWPGLLAERAGMEAAIAAGQTERAAELFTREWGTGRPWHALSTERRARIAGQMPMVVATGAALYDDSGGLLEPGALEGLEMPVLLVRGAASPPVIEVIAEALAARMPDVGVATVPDASHMVPITHPDAVAGLIGVNLDRA